MTCIWSPLGQLVHTWPINERPNRPTPTPHPGAWHGHGSRRPEGCTDQAVPVIIRSFGMLEQTKDLGFNLALHTCCGCFTYDDEAWQY